MTKKKTCPECGGDLQTRILPVKIDVAGITVTDGSLRGPVCDNGHYTINQVELEESERRAALTALTEINGPSGGVLKFARKSAGLKQTDLAKALGVSPETVCRWESNAHIDRQVSLAMAQLLTMYDEQPEQFDIVVKRDPGPPSTPAPTEISARRRKTA